MTTVDSDGAGRGWLAWHCYLHWEPAQLDGFLTGTVAPLLDELRAGDRLADWFYIRYWEGGPHLRIRVRGADPDTAAWLPGELARRVAEAPYPTRPPHTGHGAVRGMPYQPEISRYGGTAAMPVAEAVFCQSSAIALRVVAATPSPGARLAVAADLAAATALALGLDRLATARWLRRVAAAWRWYAETPLLPPAALQAQAARALATKAPALWQRWDRLQDLIGGAPPAVRWAAVVSEARRKLEGYDATLPPVSGRWWGVWTSQLHMLLNRLGVGPDEERSVCWLVAGACLAPAGPVPFFEDGAEAPDRRYHEASKFLPGRDGDQLPREPPPAPLSPAPLSPAPPSQAQPSPAAPSPASPSPQRRDREPVTLPDPDPPATPLADALRRRTSGRGRLVGPVTAADLSTLLWTSQGITHTVPIRLPDGTRHEYAHRPYPSAGASYPTRLWLAVRDVAGLPPGTYHADPAGRQLHWIGPSPSPADLAATSMWFGPDTLAQGGIDVAELPVLLGLSVAVGPLRQRYGLRALRFSALEAGHLAQTLALVGAATGLAVGMIGGFYDDLAHELFDLDGVDEVLFYLLPVGRRPR